jgi:hypothetical protein
LQLLVPVYRNELLPLRIRALVRRLLDLFDFPWEREEVPDEFVLGLCVLQFGFVFGELLVEPIEERVDDDGEEDVGA